MQVTFVQMAFHASRFYYKMQECFRPRILGWNDLSTIKHSKRQSEDFSCGSDPIPNHGIHKCMNRREWNASHPRMRFVFQRGAFPFHFVKYYSQLSRRWIPLFLCPTPFIAEISFFCVTTRCYYAIQDKNLLKINEKNKTKWNSMSLLARVRILAMPLLYVLCAIDEYYLKNLGMCNRPLLVTPKTLSYFLFDSLENINDSAYSRFNCVHFFISGRTQLLF